MQNLNITIYGINPINSFILHKTEYLREIFIQKDKLNNLRLNKMFALAKSKNVKVSIIKNINKIINVKENHQGIIAKITYPIYTKTDELLEKLENHNKDMILILDGITDPHNFGACIRSAVAFNVNAIIVPTNNSAPINSTVVKTSSGAVVSSNIFLLNNLKKVINVLQENDYLVVATALKDDENNFYKLTSSSGKIALIMGSEDKGIKKGIIKLCDEVVKIPISKNLESLNVSIATAIMLFHLTNRLKFNFK